MKPIQEIKRLSPKIDISTLSVTEKKVWTDDPNLLSVSKYALKSRIVLKLASELTKTINQSSYAKKLDKLREEYCTFKTLSYSQFKETSAYLAKRIMDKAEKLHLFLVAVDCARYLYKYYNLNNEEDKAKTYWKSYQHFNKVSRFEADAEYVYSQLESKLQRRTILKDGFRNKLSRKSTEYSRVLQSIDSAWFQLYARIIIYHQFVGNSEEKIDFLKSCAAYFNNLTFDHRSARLSFQILLVQELTALDRYAESLEIINVLIDNENKKDYTYYRMIETRLRVHFKLRNSEKIDEGIECLSSLKYKMAKTIYQRCTIYKLYNSILRDDLSNVRIKKIINDLPKFENDKSGMNLTLIIAELIINILRDNVDYLVDKKSSIIKYLSSHKLTMSREAQFIKLLLCFSYTDAEKYLKKMSTAINVDDSLELIKYETLWSMIKSRTTYRTIQKTA